MNAHVLPAIFTTRPQRLAQALAGRLAAFAQVLRQARRAAAARRELQALDAHMLRDIGVHRAEIDSLVAELTGAAPATRRAALASLPRRG